MNFQRAGTCVIGQRKIPAPFGGNHGAGESGEKRLGIAVRNGKNGNFGDDGGVFHFEALGVFCGGDAGSERVSRKNGIVGDAAALDALIGTVSAVGKRLTLNVAVALWIGIDEAADGAVFGGNLRLDAAPRMAVTRNGDGAFHGNAEAFETFVVFGQAVIDVDERSGDVAVPGISVVAGKLLGLLAGGGVNGQRGFFQFGGEFHFAAGGGIAFAFEELDQAFLRSGKEDVVGFDVRVEAKFLEFGEDPIGVFLVVRGADVVRAGGEVLHIFAHVIWTGDSAELFFPLAFGMRGFRRKAIEGRFIGGRRSSQGRTYKPQTHRTCTHE